MQPISSQGELGSGQTGPSSLAVFVKATARWRCAPILTLAVTALLQEKVETQRQRFRMEFEKHRGFLAQEEQLQLRRLEQEERATLQILRDSKSRLAQHSRALRELADELEDRCQRPALGLLEVRPLGQTAAPTDKPLGHVFS